ncbi:AI-2E family transporter [Candidatus Nanohaloarchaea archaeon]|nr:AI-2E family transporter [Candidatus Nanohaloarchaea archaeon]
MNEQKSFLVFFIAAIAAVAALMIKPFLPYVMGAAILAFISRPLHRKLSGGIGEVASAGFLVFLSIFLAIVPMVLAATVVMDDAQDLANRVGDLETIDLSKIDAKIHQLTGEDLNIEQNVREAVKRFASLSFGNVSQLFNLIANLAIGMSLMLFLQYYFIKDGDHLIEWLKEMTPLPEDIQDSLIERTNTTTWAVVKGHVLVAIAQGLVAGIGLYATGVPNPYFWTFVMTLLAFLPIVGSFLIWGPAGVYLIMIDHITAGIALLIYGVIVVGLTDNFLRPIVVDKSAELHPAVIIIGVLGGLYVFGAPGLFIGPIVLGILRSALVVFNNHYSEL